MPWSSGDIADCVTRALRARADADDREQAVYGFDAADELGLHPVVREALAGAGHGAWPEQRYPGDDGRRRRSEGRRCDLVLTPEARPLRDAALKQTLFDTPHAVDPDAAFWLEIKTVAQATTEGPSPRYAGELISPVIADVRKLLSDTVIRHAGLLLILFTAERAVGEHDLAAWHERCLRRGLPIGLPAAQHFPITDRIGNACCNVALFPVRG